MPVKIEKFKNENLKNIIISLIVSDTFCQEILPILKRDKDLTYQTFTGSYRTVLNWITDYYDKYKVSPKKYIQEIFKKQTENISKEESEMISSFLSNLNNKYEREQNFNELYAIDESKLFLRKKSSRILRQKMKEAEDSGNLDEIDRLIANHKQIEQETKIYQETDIFEDINDINECITAQEEQLFKLPGELGKRLGYFVRGDFIAVAAPSKRGKSWHLEEIAVRALLKNLRVLYFNLEMSHNKCRKRIYQNFLGEKIKIENDEYDIVKIPYFQKNTNGKYDIIHEEKKKYGLRSRAIKKKITTMKKMSAGSLKLITYPTNSLMLKELERVSDDFVSRGFVPDVIIVDYADIMADENKGEHRHTIDHKWKSLRGLAQKKHCLMVTASHTSKATFSKSVGQDNLTEDYRKLNHITMMYALNQNGEDIDNGIMRVNIIGHRDRRFNPDDFIVVLQCLDIGKCYLDSRSMKEVNYHKNKK